MTRIITIGRQLGSGGREIGRRIAESLQIAYYDQEIIRELARRTDLAENYIRNVEERKPVPLMPITTGQSFSFYYAHMEDPQQKVYVEQSRLIKEIAETSDCVIVGRCADYILREMNPFRIFIYADLPARMARCRARGKEDEQMSDKDLKKKILSVDKARRDYYQYFTDQKWGDKESYDLMVNTTDRDIKEVTAAIIRYLG
jgi:cytidylate kinase